jgi:hypothetical protein
LIREPGITRLGWSLIIQGIFVMHTIIRATFDSRKQAELAVSRLREAGALDKSLSLSPGPGSRVTAADGEPEQDEANIFRGVLGGGALGAGLGVAALAMPGMGPIAAAGAVAASAVPAALTIGAAAGAAAGTMNEVLDKSSLGRDAEQHDVSGCVVVALRTGPAGISSEIAQEILCSSGGYNLSIAEALS